MTGWWTFGLQIANFLVLVWLLHRFLYRPVLATIAERRERAEAAAARVATAQAEADRARDAVATERAGLVTEHDRLIGDARAQAAVEQAALVARAKAEAEQIVAAGHAALAEERAAALAELESHATQLATEIAAHLLGEVGSAQIDDAFLARVDAYLDALPRERSRALADEGTAGVEIVTAHPLAPDAIARWRQRLADRLGRSAQLAFSSDPSLIGGAELHFRSAVVRVSWRDALGHTAEAMRGRATAG